MYMVVLWCERRKSGKTPPFSHIFQRICMQMCPLPIIREGKASKNAPSKLLIFYPFHLVFTWFILQKHFGPLLRSYTHDMDPALLRVVVASREFQNVDDLIMDVANGGSARLLAVWALAMRTNRRSRKDFTLLLFAHGIRKKPRWYTVFSNQLLLL